VPPITKVVCKGEIMNLDINQIAPNLFQGANPPKGDVLHAQGFTSLVLCAREWQAPAKEYANLKVTHAPMEDGPYIPKATAHRAAKFAAAEVAKGHKTLIVCNMGWNRSGLVSALTLWNLTGDPGVDCLWQVQAARPRALCNRYFAAYLFRLPPRRKRG